MVIVGVDPGFKHLGFSAALLSFDLELTPLEMVYSGTTKSAAKLGLRAKSDDMRRLSVIRDEFLSFISSWSADVYAFEECPTVRNSSSSRKIALGWGGCYCLATRREGALTVEYSPQHLKKVVTGNNQASKQDVQQALRARFPGLQEPDVAKSKLEHPFDALAACVAAAEDDSVKALVAVVRRTSA